MATGTAPTNAAASPEAAPHPHADLVEDHVRRTQAYLRSCDIAGAVITIVVFVLGYLMAMALIDHWIWPGGLGRGGRLVACLTMLVLVGVYVWWALVPHLLRRINPVYAADRLERAQPSLMNSLVNLLMLRSQERPVSDAVMRGLERQAATGIEHLPAEAAVDRRKLLRTAYVLVGVLLFCALYVVFSPKSPLISAARILIPWADIPAVTRVRIEKVRPGSDDVYRGEPVTVTAEIRGLRDDEPVTLRYASVDGQTDNQSVAMFRREGQTTHSCQLPPDTAGMQRDLDYQIVAGDTKSAEFRLHVVPAPTIQIESIEYRYPAYTGMPPLTVERLGDIKGLEGTQVVIRAKSSQPIGTASVQLSGLRDTTLPMQTRGELAARVELPLKLVNVQGGRDPQYTSYKLDVTNAKGNHNREPASYRIEVTPDLPPQVDVFEPKERDIQLPADKELSIEVRARDADFALSDVRLLATRKGERLLDQSLVKERKIRLDQPVRTAYRFVPGRHGLKAGDEVLFRVAAIDNKRPQPNRQLTPEYRIAIVAPESSPMQKREPNQQDMQPEGTPQKQEDQVAAGKAPKGEQGKAGEKQSSQESSDKSEKGAKGEESEKGEKGAKGAKGGDGEKGEKGEGNEAGSGSESQGSEGSEQQKDGASKSKDEGSGAASDSAAEASDPIDDGEAVQRIVKHLEQQGQKPEDQQQSGDSGGSKSGDESQMASADKQDSKQDNKQDSKQKDSQKPDKGDSQKSPKDDGQGSQQPDSKDQSGSSSGEKSNDQKQGEKQDGDKNGQQKDGQQQGSQKSQSGQQGQSQPGGGGKSEQQGSQSGSQGNSSGQGQQSSSEQSSGDQQGSSKEGASSSAQGQKGSSSSDAKQPGSGDRQTQQAQSNPSNKSSSGDSQADSKQQGSRPGDQTAQKQPGEGAANQQAMGEKQLGSQSEQDKTASAQQRPGDKSQGHTSVDKQSAEKPKGDGSSKEGSSKDGGDKDDIAKKPDDQVASNDPTQKQQGQKQSGQKQTGPQKSGEGQSSEQQKGENAEGAKTKGMNPGERDPQSQPQQQPEASDGGKPQSGGAQGRQQEDGSSGEGKGPEDKAKDIAQKSGESSDNRASGEAKDKPQDHARAPGKTPAKGQQAASDSKTSEEDSKAPEKQRPSDTGSDQGGERAGKGQEGMGQASSGAGGGSAGKNQAADDGGSRSQKSGPGDQSNRAGNQQQTDKATGKAGQQAGDARTGRPENDQRQSGNSQRWPEDSQPGEPNPEAQQGMQPGQGQQVEGQPSQQASGSGGDPAAGRSGPSSSKPNGTVVPGSEQANLEYSKRATDLTLTYLQDQLAKGRIDDGLRKRLGWSEEEFQSLLKRMQSMRDRGSDAAAKPEDKQAYEQWLKSLGLRPSTGAVRTGKVESKPLANSRDDAPVSVPRDLREQHEAFRQGLLEKSR